MSVCKSPATCYALDYCPLGCMGGKVHPTPAAAQRPMSEIAASVRKQNDALRDALAPKVQPTAPTQEADSVVAAVRADLLARSELGMKKYKVPLSGAGLDHKQWLQHAYEEALDMANYLKCAILTADSK